MRAAKFSWIVLIAGLVGGALSANAAEKAEKAETIRAIELSPELLNLLRSEMREITNGVQRIAASIAIADWKSIQETSVKIRDSYILAKKLTPAQVEELERALPEQFKQLDASFHQRAEKVAAAAKAQDVELVNYHYSRLLEACAGCHTAYAKSRFPGFSVEIDQSHHH